MNSEILIILACGVLALLYGGWTIRSVLSLSAVDDPGSLDAFVALAQARQPV